MSVFDEVLEVWFGPDGLSVQSHQARWFAKDPAFDASLRERFSALHQNTLARPLEPLDTAAAALGRVILLDQFSRNMFRDTPAMYAADPLALQAVSAAVQAGYPEQVPALARTFFWMPWMHSEDLADQDRCVAAFEAMGPQGSGSLDYARQHRVIVARFGRFPHRNALLGRPSTPEETAFLAEPGSSF